MTSPVFAPELELAIVTNFNARHGSLKTTKREREIFINSHPEDDRAFVKKVIEKNLRLNFIQ